MSTSGLKKPLKLHSRSRQETLDHGRSLAKSIKKGAIIALHGDLGAGKTTFVKGLAEGLGAAQENEITSPTFTYLQSYGDLHHFDLYRLNDAEEFYSMGFDEYFDDGCCCVEWPERLGKSLPETALHISIHILSDDERMIEVTP